MSKDKKKEPKEKEKMKEEEESKEKNMVEKEERESVFKKIADKLRTLQKETNFSLYLGTGLYEIALGMGLTFLVSFLIGLPIVMAYPILNPTMLWAFKIIGWVLFILGIITCLLPIIIPRLSADSKILKMLWITMFFNSVILIFLIPIGIFLGLSLYQQFSESKIIEEFELLTEKTRYRYLLLEKVLYVIFSILVGLSIGLVVGGDYKTPFILGPIGTFILLPTALLISINIRGRLAEKYKWDKEEKSIRLYYFLFLFIAGALHTLLGLLFVFIVPDLLRDAVDLIFPYVTYDTVTFITILGWINLIPGLVLLISSFWAKRFSKQLERETISTDVKVMKILILIASVFLLPVFPVGTFFGITLILEFYYFGKHEIKN